MVDPTHQRGETGRPLGPEPEKEEQQIDPEKFKKALKVEELTESEKKNQRQQQRLQQEEEEGEESDPTKKASNTPPPSTSFSEFMTDENELDNLYDAESAGVRKQAAPQTPIKAPEAGSIDTEGVELEEEPTTQVEAQPQMSSPYEVQQPTPQAVPEQPQEESPPPYQEEVPQTPSYSTSESQTDQNQPDYTQQQVQPTTEDQAGQHQESSKEKGKDSSLLASQVKKGALKSKKKPSKKAAPRVETLPPKEDKTQPSTPSKSDEAPTKTPNEAKKGEKVAEKPLEAPLGEAKPLPEPKEGLIPKEEGKKIEEPPAGISAKKRSEITLPPETPEQAPLRSREKGESAFKQFTPDQIFDQKKKKPVSPSMGVETAEEFAAPALSQDMGMMGEGRRGKKDDFPFIDSNELIAALPTSDKSFSPVQPTAETPAYSKLSPEVYELFEKMAGTIMIQNHSGITSTTVTLNMPHSIFHEAQISFDRYQTAPNSYNLQLSGSPEAVDALTSNMADLTAAFKQSDYAFEVNILRPSLATKKPLIRRKKSAGGRE